MATLKNKQMMQQEKSDVQPKWWKEAVVYEIYPISFKDSNGDGIGDLRGIISKLDYLQHLGVDVLWLCPVYQSPGQDNGYDISDYYAIKPQFGTMEDFDELLKEAHDRGLKIMMDLVLNHTSDEHPWFIEARSSKTSAKRDYYIWRDGKNGSFPNNWESYFGGSVWQLDEQSGQYYLHLYSEYQPDLNWENTEMVRELHTMIRWWLEKGVDGFRFDAIAHIVKAEGLPDADNPEQLPFVQAYPYFSNLEHVHDLLRKLNEDVLTASDVMTVGETSGLGPEQALEYVGDGRRELDMVFQFEHMTLDTLAMGAGRWEPRSWTLPELKKIMSRWQTTLHNRGWNANYLGNHDQPRQVSRFGNDQQYRMESAKMLATFLLTLEGTPYLYQGEEIGMTNVSFAQIEDYKDIETLNFYKLSQLENVPEHKIMAAIHAKSRDNARTPMQWDASDNAGFTDGKPWIKVNSNYREINVETALKDTDSIYHYYRMLLALRKQHKVIIYGEYTILLPLDPNLYVYTRTLHEQCMLIILNFSQNTVEFERPHQLVYDSEELLISNYAQLPEEDGKKKTLRPYEARVYKLVSAQQQQ